MDMYGYSGVLLAKRFLDDSPSDVTNMSDIGRATSPHGCDDGALTDRFGVLIQALLAVVAFSTLMLKRFHEPVGVRRPWRIWFYDTSKQAIGALFIHFANVFLSTLTKADPCSLYLMNFLLDATIGMLVIWLAVKLVSRLVEHKQWTLLMFGEYGDPPRAAAWLGQCGVYLLIMVLEKGVISLVLLIPGWSKLQEVLLGYIANPQLELALVMLIVPFIVNSIMFWVVDSLMMRKYKTMKSLDDDSCGGGVAAAEKADALPWANGDESRVLLTVETDTDEASEGEEDAGPLPNVHYSGGPVRPSWVLV
ncbi:putative transmembrane protein 110-like [Scophthalmus maximus]|uniref:Putative transmembrane protein 110-like n=1 Tax=Scophthalmus maximus TaxID=52904 RepID=A0A2U9B325_SCOMX|nr:transmembrane protein 110, like [Scophthalmus maximus]XP_035476690.1 transmembrane protein 110, like [Scophthalmus maximus]AWO98267.1 putative transmembrane protein 110-like [Scophthalmus maximus]